MARTIGNPLSWGARMLGAAGHDIGEVTRELGGAAVAAPEPREIGIGDLRAALRAGLADFMALRTDVIAICLLYPIIGGSLVWLSLRGNLLPLIFPLISGFALVGPAAAAGLYEMSRRREAGEAAGWADGLRLMQSPVFGAIVILALAHLAVFSIWILVAYGIFLNTMGPEVPATAMAFFTKVLTTPQGWAMIAIGLPVGLAFAILVLASSVVSFPLLIDRHVGLPVAVVTSVRVARKNPATVAIWGAIVAGGLVLGALPLLLGLAVILPILGHATWHLYRRAVT